MMLSVWLFILGAFGIGTTIYYMVLKGKDKTGKLFSKKLKTAVLLVVILARVVLAVAVGSLLVPDLWNGDVGFLVSLFSFAYMGVAILVFSAVDNVRELYLRGE